MTETMTRTRAQTWRLFPVTVGAVRRMSSSFTRITFTGDALREFGDDRDDQRIKVILPAPDGSLEVEDSERMHWYQDVMSREESRRNPIRTYTSRTVRPEDAEVDVDFVLHGDEGPASRWANRAAVGDEVILCGPNRLVDGPYGGTGFKPAEGTERFLLVADETAVPAALAILEGLPRTATGAALLEVPHTDDALPVHAPAGVQVRWLPREGAPVGALLAPAVRQLVDLWLGPQDGSPTSDQEMPVDDPDGFIWDVPEEATAGAFYAWLAGEAGVVTGLRRHLVKERGVDRRSVAFMGYWRAGRAEGSA
jgi:iron complex transport system ATP-binding protein